MIKECLKINAKDLTCTCFNTAMSIDRTAGSKSE